MRCGRLFPFSLICLLIVVVSVLLAKSNSMAKANKANLPPDAQTLHARKDWQAALPTNPGVSFAKTTTYSSGGYYAASVAVGDVNGDGKSDLVVANICQSIDPSGSCNGPGEVSVLLGNGNGTFQAATSYSSDGYSALSVKLGDVNGDGKPDIVVANQCQSSSNCNGVVSVLLGNGNGTFQAPVGYSSGGFSAESVALGDVNGDGHVDIVVANFSADSNNGNGAVSILLGNGDGTFQAATSYSSGGEYALSVVLGDVNGDGYLDLAVANYCQGDNPPCGSGYDGIVGVLLGNGDGTFRTPVAYNSGAREAYSVAVGDVNGDGYLDLIVANWCDICNTGEVGVLLGNGDGTFKTAANYSSGGQHAIAVAVADVNGDGKQDVIVANPFGGPRGSGAVGVLLGNGDGTFQIPLTYSSGKNAGSFSVAVADLNADGRPDVVVANECATSEELRDQQARLAGSAAEQYRACWLDFSSYILAQPVAHK